MNTYTEKLLILLINEGKKEFEANEIQTIILYVNIICLVQIL